MAAHPYLDTENPIGIAHRGGALEAPENSMAAFREAVGAGYQYLETDVHATADGELVVFHDEHLDRVTNATGPIVDKTWEDLSAVRIAGSNEPLAKLRDVLLAFPHTRFNLDPKASAAVAPLAEMIGELEVLDRVCVGSFSDRRLETLRERLGPRLCTALGPTGVRTLRLRSLMIPVGHGSGLCAQVPTRYGRFPLVDRMFLRAARRLGIAVHVWTIDDADEMHRLLDLGVDGIMTDRPAVLRAVFEDRGIWPA